MMGLLKQVVPIAASLYAGRMLSAKLDGRLPVVPAQFQSVAVSAGLLALAHFATKRVGMLRKYRDGIMIGLGINLIDKALKSFAPGVAGMLGVGEYVTLGDYLSVGAPPIQDNIALSDYVSVGEYGELEQDLGLDQELGMLEQELGVEQDLGAFGDNRLGGVSRGSMLAPVQSQRWLSPVPPRSFTSEVPGFNSDFDNPARLYTGMFAGGF
jgi:hypothetical protein